MRSPASFRLRLIFMSLLLAGLTIPPAARLSVGPALQSASLSRILDSNMRPNPVVNEGNQMTLIAVDANSQPVTSGVAFESGSPDIAAVDPATGVVRGMMRGFATVTARRGSESVSTFVAVTRVESVKGARVSGDAKNDNGGRIYLSDPLTNVILRKDDFSSDANGYAGKGGANGNADGKRMDALFAGPTAVDVDNGKEGGIYIADTLNHSIRKIDFDSQSVSTVTGTGSPGMNTSDTTSFDQAQFNGPRGIAVSGGFLFIADTDNHAIFIADLNGKQVALLAGTPGMNGKADGQGLAARFFRPSSIALSRDGKSIAVADTGNNRMRLITLDGIVTTISSSTSLASSEQFSNECASFEIDHRSCGQDARAPSPSATQDPAVREAPGSAGVPPAWPQYLQTTNEVVFDAPQSVGFDDQGNLFVVDRSGVQVVSQPLTNPRVFRAAQDGAFKRASSVTLVGNRVVVVDSNETNNDLALKVVTLGEPTIAGISVDTDRLEGGAEVVVTGKNFAPDSLVFLGDIQVNAMIESATSIRFKAPAQNAPGRRTLSVQTRGGTAQRLFNIVAKTLSEIANGQITTIAGGVPFLGDNGKAINALFKAPQGLAFDTFGNLFVSDAVNNRIRRIDASGNITTIAGTGVPSFGGDGNQALTATLNIPLGIALDRNGNLLIADQFNQRIRRLNPQTGVIATAVGNGIPDLSGDGGPAANAAIAGPAAIAVDNSGNILIADTFNHRIRRIDARTGVISTIAGTGLPGLGNGQFGGDGGPASQARFDRPFGLAVDSVGNIFIADTFNNRIRRIDMESGTIDTIAGMDIPIFTGDGGPAKAAGLAFPTDIAIDRDGNLLIADFGNNRIRRIDAITEIITTVAGNGDFGFGGDGGPATQATLASPSNIVLDTANNIFIADSINNRIRRVDAITENITTFAGTAIPVGDGGPAVKAGLANPKGVAIDRNGNILISDRENNIVRRVDAATGIITTIAGNGDFNFSGDDGPAVTASLARPGGITLDAAGNIFIADNFNNRIRRVDAVTGVITTVAGNGSIGSEGDGGSATEASLTFPDDVAVDSAGNLFIADSSGQRIRRVDGRTKIITKIAGDDNVALNFPQGITLDSAGNIIFADTGNQRIRRIDARTGAVTIIAGNGMSGFSGDGGPATAASFSDPLGVALDGAGNLFIADEDNNRIRRIDAATGVISTAAGNGTAGFSGDGGAATAAQIAFAKGVAFDSMGNLYIAGGFNNAVRVVKGIGAAQSAVTITNAAFNKPNLVVAGSGFGASGAMVSVNGKDISSTITNQTAAQITLKGNKKKLNLKKGANQVVVTVNGRASNAFTFNF